MTISIEETLVQLQDGAGTYRHCDTDLGGSSDPLAQALETEPASAKPFLQDKVSLKSKLEVQS